MKLGDLLLHIKNQYTLKKVIPRASDFLIPKECAKLIREGTYDNSYDLNQDGYLDAADYDALYNNFYAKYREVNIVELATTRKRVGGSDARYDLDNDSLVTEIDTKIMRHWILFGKEPKETL